MLKNTIEQMDCLLCSLPYSFIDMPKVGAPILSAILKKHNFKTKLIDFNLKLYEILKKTKPDITDNWKYLSNIFCNINILKDKNITRELDLFVEEIIQYNPKYIGISLFSTLEIFFLIYLIKELKNKTDIKIILGGPGISRMLEIKNNISKFNLDLIDHIVVGYGEEVLINILNKKETRQIIYNNDIIPDFSTSETPDYSDLNLNKYSVPSTLSVYFSKGCLYNCTFCNYNSVYKRHRVRPIKHFIKEIKTLIEKYNVRNFYFWDSMINFDDKILESLCKELIPLNITWKSFWRINNSKNNYIYKLVKDSGCEYLRIGIESGSEEIRSDMKKHFTNNDIFNLLVELNKNNIAIHLIFMTGYPTETLNHFQETLNFIDELKRRKYHIEYFELFNFMVNDKRLECHKNNKNYLDGMRRKKLLEKHIKSKGFNVNSVITAYPSKVLKET